MNIRSFLFLDKLLEKFSDFALKLAEEVDGQLYLNATQKSIKNCKALMNFTEWKNNKTPIRAIFDDFYDAAKDYTVEGQLSLPLGMFLDSETKLCNLLSVSLSFSISVCLSLSLAFY